MDNGFGASTQFPGFELPSPSRFFWGNVKKNSAPRSTAPVAQVRPPCRAMILCTVASPTPVPGNSACEWRR
jgi:hypothetical protein